MTTKTAGPSKGDRPGTPAIRDRAARVGLIEGSGDVPSHPPLSRELPTTGRNPTRPPRHFQGVMSQDVNPCRTSSMKRMMPSGATRPVWARGGPAWRRPSGAWSVAGHRPQDMRAGRQVIGDPELGGGVDRSRHPGADHLLRELLPGLHFVHRCPPFSVADPRRIPDFGPEVGWRGTDNLTACFGHGTSEPILEGLDGDRLRGRAVLVIRPLSRLRSAAPRTPRSSRRGHSYSPT
jgi:hypothetical protein